MTKLAFEKYGMPTPCPSCGCMTYTLKTGKCGKCGKDKKMADAGWKRLKEDIMAENLLRLAKYHRKNCDGDCGIQLILVRDVYEKIVGRKLLDEEERVFL